MNTSMFIGAISLLLGAAGVWASRIKLPKAPYYFPEGTVLNYLRVSYFLGLAGGFLIFWGIFSKISNFSVRLVLKIMLVFVVLWIGWRFYETNVWDWQRFWQF
jgi:hypothetical protein